VQLVGEIAIGHALLLLLTTAPFYYYLASGIDRVSQRMVSVMRQKLQQYLTASLPSQGHFAKTQLDLYRRILRFSYTSGGTDNAFYSRS
jgi:hypothetical protein